MYKKVFLDDSEIRKPSENLAINNHYSNLVSDNKYDAIARIYRHSNGIILGRNHDISDVDLEACAKEGYEVARRVTGGLAVIVDPSVLCYSLFISKNIVANDDIKEIYKKVVLPLAEKLGKNFMVKGNYYIRQNVEGEYIPVAGHSMSGSSEVIQLDGIVHNEPLNIAKTKSLLRLRELRNYQSQKYIGFENKIYNLKNKETDISFDQTDLIQKEEDILSKIKGLSYSGVSEEEFIEYFHQVLSSEFGKFYREDVSGIEEILDDKSLFNILNDTSRNYKKARGHCFVDFADPEEIFDKNGK